MEVTNLSTILTFDGILFKGREKDIRVTSDKKVSVFDFIQVVGGKAAPRSAWKRIFDNHKEELAEHLDSFPCLGYKKKSTPTINLDGILKLITLIPDENGRVKQFCEFNIEKLQHHLGSVTEEDDEDMDDGISEDVDESNDDDNHSNQQIDGEDHADIEMNHNDSNQDQEAPDVEDNAGASSSENLSLSMLQFNGIFRGRENEIRITADNKVSVLDIIRVVGGQENQSLAGKRILKQHDKEVLPFL